MEIGRNFPRNFSKAGQAHERGREGADLLRTARVLRARGGALLAGRAASATRWPPRPRLHVRRGDGGDRPAEVGSVCVMPIQFINGVEVVQCPCCKGTGYLVCFEQSRQWFPESERERFVESTCTHCMGERYIRAT